MGNNKVIAAVIVVVLVIAAVGVFYFQNLQPVQMEPKPTTVNTSVGTPNKTFQLPDYEKRLPVYWEIRKGDQLQGYVVPSVHISRFSYIVNIAELLKTVDTLALEIDEGEVRLYLRDNPEVFSRPNYHIENNLTPDIVNKARTLVGDRIWYSPLIVNKTPGSAASTILSFSLFKNGYNQTMDSTSYVVAKIFNKTVVGLEDMFLQLDALANSSYDADWIQIITEFFLEEDPLSSMDELEKLYAEGDLKKYKEVYDQGANESSLISYFQTVRDPVIQQRSKEVLSQGKTLIMVGALHVPDLVKFLEDEYTLVEKRAAS